MRMVYEKYEKEFSESGRKSAVCPETSQNQFCDRVGFAGNTCVSCFGNGIEHLVDFLKKFVSTTDKVIIVAMITGMVSIVGVVFTSVIAKIIDYRYNVKKYLYDKREAPYEQFISIIYTIMENTKNL